MTILKSNRTILLLYDLITSNNLTLKTKLILVIVLCVHGRNLPIDTEMYIQCNLFDIHVHGIYHKKVINVRFLFKKKLKQSWIFLAGF